MEPDWGGPWSQLQLLILLARNVGRKDTVGYEADAAKLLNENILCTDGFTHQCTSPGCRKINGLNKWQKCRILFVVL